jgi:hypothetical protein
LFERLLADWISWMMCPVSKADLWKPDIPISKVLVTALLATIQIYCALMGDPGAPLSPFRAQRY